MKREDVDTSPENIDRLTHQCRHLGLPHDYKVEAVLRALLAERDAAFAAGQEEMRNEAAFVAADEGRFETARLIRLLPIKPRP